MSKYSKRDSWFLRLILNIYQDRKENGQEGVGGEEEFGQSGKAQGFRNSCSLVLLFLSGVEGCLQSPYERMVIVIVPIAVAVVIVVIKTRLSVSQSCSHFFTTNAMTSPPKPIHPTHPYPMHNLYICATAATFLPFIVRILWLSEPHLLHRVYGTSAQTRQTKMCKSRQSPFAHGANLRIIGFGMMVA